VAACLLAIKSLYIAVGQGRVLFIDDGSLTLDNLAILHHHIPGTAVLDIASISTGTRSSLGTWQWLVKVVELSANNFVIQADADILASAPISEVVER